MRDITYLQQLYRKLSSSSSSPAAVNIFATIDVSIVPLIYEALIECDQFLRTTSGNSNTWPQVQQAVSMLMGELQ
jgi:hypothetical protein